MSSDVIIIQCTCRDMKEAEFIGKALLEARLVACVEITPGGQSMFWWKGKIETTSEVYLGLKTRAGKYFMVEKMIKRLHSYEVPCIISHDIKDGNAPYLNWVRGETF